MEGRRFKRGGSEESENDSRKNYSISDAQPQPQVEIRWVTLWFLTNFNKKTWIWFMKQRQNLFYTHCVGLLLWKARMGGKPFHTWLKRIVFQQLDRAETDVNKMQSGYDWSGVVLRRSATLSCREWPKKRGQRHKWWKWASFVWVHQMWRLWCESSDIQWACAGKPSCLTHYMSAFLDLMFYPVRTKKESL